MANEKNDLAKQNISGLFELAKLHRAQKDITSKTDTIEDKLQKKLDHLKLTGEMEEKVPPIVVGNTGIILDGNNISKTSYLGSLKVDDSLYGDLILTEEQATRINHKMNKFTSGVNSVIPMLCTGSRCAFKATCLAGDTLILMFNGTFKKIKDIKRGDRIVSFNKGTRKLELDMAKTNSSMKGLKPVYRLTTEFGHELILTDDHPVYSSEMGIHPFDYACIKTGLAEGDTVIVSDAFPNDCLEVSIEEVEEYGDTFVAEITSIELIGEEEVYDFPVYGNKNFVASGIVTHNCPYYQEDKAPLGLPCLVESNLLYFYTSQYMEEFDVDQSRFTELHLIGELAEFDIYEMRATKLIAEKYPTMLQEVCMGFDSDGNAIINEDISRVFELKERLKKSRMKILETLMATRKERAKAIIASNANEQIGVTSLRSKLDMLLKEVKDHGGPNKGRKPRNDDVIDAEVVE